MGEKASNGGVTEEAVWNVSAVVGVSVPVAYGRPSGCMIDGRQTVCVDSTVVVLSLDGSAC